MAVRILQQAAAEHLKDLAYLVTCLKADPQAAEFAPNVEAAAVALQAQSEDWQLHRHAAQEARTGIRIAGESISNVVRTAQHVILGDLRHNRRSPTFLTYFPFGLLAFTRTSRVDQLTAVRTLARQCTQDPSPKIREQAGLLHAAADQMSSAFARRSEALVAETASCGRLQVQKLQAIETCRRAGYRLAELYPNEWDRVRSYFRPIYHRPRSAMPAAGKPTPQPATAANAALAGAVLQPMCFAANL
jgi:hypothetical protein